MIETVAVGPLDVGYERWGDTGGWPVVLLHGFPYDVRAYDRVWPALVAEGAQVVSGSGTIDLGRFVGPCERRDLANVGHNVPQEAPEAFAAAVVAAHRMLR